jgi:hypothetical protein
VSECGSGDGGLCAARGGGAGVGVAGGAGLLSR